MKKTILIAVGIIVAAAIVVIVILMNQPRPALQSAPENEVSEALSIPEKPVPVTNEGDVEIQDGRYLAYSEDAVAEPGYGDTIIFFHAAWCPECRAFEQAITGSPIPPGVQVLKADYDSEETLRQRYGVTLQSTFVKVDTNGYEISKWVGYGRWGRSGR